MDRNGVERWLAAYETAWRDGRPEDLDTLFTPSAVYRPSPTAAPIEGLDAIRRWWRAESDPREQWDLTSEVLAVDGDTAVARLDVRYRAPEAVRYVDLWILRFITDGRCAAFEEWWWRDPPSS